jgi:hypothetical protein
VDAEPVSSVEIQVSMLQQIHLQRAWERFLSAPLGLPANWRYGRLDRSPGATFSSMTVYYDKHWAREGGHPQTTSVPVRTQISFAYIRDYESTVTAAYIKDEKQATRSSTPSSVENGGLASHQYIKSYPTLTPV